MYSISLLSSEAVIEAPFIKIDIGTDPTYTFGIYKREAAGAGAVRITYPDYVKSLEISKINGTVNQYTLNMVYPITAESDPNFIEKVLSSVSDTRRIKFSYGDFMLPNYIFGEEEALITDVTSNVNITGSSISYVIKAVSSGALTLSGNYTFPKRYAKPSQLIREMLYQSKYNLLSIFKGMQNKSKVDAAGLLAADDKFVEIEMQSNISPLDYINYLVSCMVSSGDTTQGSTNRTIYSLVIDDDREGLFGGPYFKIQKVQRNSNTLDSISTYTIDIGYPTANLVTNFQIKNNQGYSILYDYNNAINSYNYGKRIDDNGNISYVYAQPLTSSRQLHLTTEADKNWWTKVTEFPIEVSLTIRGLLRPTLLMNYIKLNVWFYGRKHISSGYYIITSQTDTINEGGFRTNLTLTRIAPDGDIDTAVGLFGENLNRDSELDKDLIGKSRIDLGAYKKNKSNINNTKLDAPRNVYIHQGNKSRGAYVQVNFDKENINTSLDDTQMNKPWVDNIVKGQKK